MTDHLYICLTVAFSKMSLPKEQHIGCLFKSFEEPVFTFLWEVASLSLVNRDSVLSAANISDGFTILQGGCQSRSLTLPSVHTGKVCEEPKNVWSPRLSSTTTVHVPQK